MRVLDLDLDLFLDSSSRYAGEGHRVEEGYNTLWPESNVTRFLRDACGLSDAVPTPGAFVERHDGVFHTWRNLIDADVLSVPFDVVHADGHADLGLNFAISSSREISMKLLRHPVGSRPSLSVASESFDEGSYLLFAIACRWLRTLTYVYPPNERADDFAWTIMEDFNCGSGAIRLPHVRADSHFGGGLNPEADVISYEPVVPFSRVSADSFSRGDVPFDFVFLSHSPEYTPASADDLLPLIRRFIRDL